MSALSEYRSLLDDRTRFATLPDAERRAVGELLRDAFFSLSAGRGGEETLFYALVDAIDGPPTDRALGLSLSFHPTASRKALRFVEIERLRPETRELFARPSADVPHLAAVFVDARELSLRTFENIVPLDRLLPSLSLSLRDLRPLGGEVLALTLDGTPETSARLLGLDTLGLYVPPLNDAARGGLRFIFHSALLAEQLTQALRAALPAEMQQGFAHVNPIFRCNRFAPGDAPFEAHLDTPYRDAARHHISRYTLLVYLTGGKGAGALRFDSCTLDEMAPWTVLVFPQHLAHAGAPYTDGLKLFLRTELVYEARDLDHDPSISALFSRACYLTGESLFAPALQRDAGALYNRAALAHWRGKVGEDSPSEPLLHKDFRGTHFVTNGYDFWFPKGTLSLKECAALALLDVFNAQIGGSPFRALCRSSVIAREDLGAVLARSPLPEEPPLAEIDKALFFPEPEAVDDNSCCPFHAWAVYEPTRCGDILDLHTRAQTFAKARIGPAYVLVMGAEIFLDPERFVVERDKIHVLGDRALEPLNFASCWTDETTPPDWVGVDVTVHALIALVPPILYVEAGDSYHLMLDLFRNGWMVRHTEAEVPVPKVQEFLGQEAFDTRTRWVESVPEASVAAQDRSPHAGPWWGDDSPLLRELYAR